METRNGPARFHLDGSGAGLLVLGHGAGGGTRSVDLLAARQAAHGAGFRVALVEQPWRVRGRKVAEPPPTLDIGWEDVLATLQGAPLVVGGRSAGARVACRTAAAVGAHAVLCLAFPLHPPGRPERSRLPELELVDVPLLVVQGDRDAFGVPPGATLVPGADHGFRVAKGLPGAGPQVREHVETWLRSL
ncbi:MAG: alpha/beta hydrolase [Frankiales bacterium]|nr:alpha/beta hydrolase [Frankiales bacterium]